MNGRSKPVNSASFDDRPLSIPRTKGPQTRSDRLCPDSSRGELEEKSDRRRFSSWRKCNSYRTRSNKLTQHGGRSWRVGFAAPETRRASPAGGLLIGVAVDSFARGEPAGVTCRRLY